MIDWQRRALEAESKLEAYRALREQAEQAVTAWELRGASPLAERCTKTERRERLATQMEELRAELVSFDLFDPTPRPTEFFDQVVRLGTPENGTRLSVRRGPLPETDMSSLHLGSREIVVNESHGSVENAFGLFFQVFVFADALATMDMGDDGHQVSSKKAYLVVSTLFYALISLRLTNPELGVSPEDVLSLIDRAMAERAKMAGVSVH